jgi:hypothetical protein
MTRVIKRLVGEMVVLAAAIAVTFGTAQLVGPGDFPVAGGPGEKQRFYNHLFVATLVPLPAGIVAYHFLRMRYARWRARGVARSSDRPDNPPLERTGQ